VSGHTLKEFTKDCLDALKDSTARQAALEGAVSQLTERVETMTQRMVAFMETLQRPALTAPAPSAAAPSDTAPDANVCTAPLPSAGNITAYYAPAVPLEYHPSASHFPRELSRALRAFPMSSMLRRWYVEELFAAKASGQLEQRVKGKMANAARLMRYFLPAGAHITRKPHNVDIDEYGRWVRAIDAYCCTATVAAVKFCEEHRSIADADDDGAEPPTKRR
jgi:hypothetical protein